MDHPMKKYYTKFYILLCVGVVALIVMIIAYWSSKALAFQFSLAVTVISMLGVFYNYDRIQNIREDEKQTRGVQDY